MNQIHLQRLETLYQFLETVPPEQFSLEGEWHDGEFTFCAVGWGTQCPTLQAAGLSLRPPKDIGEAAVPQFENTRNWDAVNAFFGLTPAESEFLFLPDYYDSTTLGEVRERLRKFIASRTL